MTVKKVSSVVWVLMVSMSAFGQTAPTAQTPRRPTPPVSATAPPPSPPTSAPQVVTVLHRLNGLKMFRLLLHSGQGAEAIANLDETFKLMDDVHTNVIAGLALEDGETIAARLPEVEVESTFVFAPPPGSPFGPTTDPLTHFRGNLLESPDLTVIDSEGKRMSARFVGVDGSTGLSILRISGRLPAPPRPPKNDNLIDVGAGVRLLGPEPAPPKRFGVSNLYFRMGESSGTISFVFQAPSGDVTRFKARAMRLSSASVGGIAVNAKGETIGIIDSVNGTEASILPAALIRSAARRVLASQASVPKPWLGVKGDPIASLEIEQIQKQGWELLGASNLAQAHRGILLTSITPNSPAALAALKAGDVILKVNDEEIQSAEDFSWFLEQAGPSSNVAFTVLKPGQSAEEQVNVVLSASPKKMSAFTTSKLARTPRSRWLVSQGIETIALRPGVAIQLGATAGLLVVHVEPGTLAFEAGLQPGDVIQKIDGRSVATFVTPASTPATFEIIRGKLKLVVALSKPPKNQ